MLRMSRKVHETPCFHRHPRESAMALSWRQAQAEGPGRTCSEQQRGPHRRPCHPELRTAFSGKGGKKRRVRGSAHKKSRHPERSASARERRCAQSKDACAPFVSGSALRLRAAGTAGAKLISVAALRSGCFRRLMKGLVSEQRGTPS